MSAEEYRVALEALAGGRFAEARDAFGDLVERVPDSVEYAAGFYAAGWRLNREDARARQRPGRALADWCMHEWDEFQRIAEAREWTNLPPYHAAMRAMLADAAENYRTAFQEEGASAADITLLKTLAACLIRLEEYTDAADILYYARRKSPRDAAIYFLLGEALASLKAEGALERGLSFFRDAFYLNHREIDPGLLASEPAASVFRELFAELENNAEATLEWFPARLMAVSFLPGLRRLSEAELAGLEHEAARLARDLSQVIEKYRERVRARLCFCYLCLMQHHKFTSKDRAALDELEDRLKAAEPALYTLYRENLKKG